MRFPTALKIFFLHVGLCVGATISIDEATLRMIHDGEQIHLKATRCSELKSEVEALSQWKLSKDENSHVLKVDCAESPHLTQINISSLIPNALKPHYNKTPFCDGPNCLNIALIDAQILEDIRYVGNKELTYYLKYHCRPRDIEEGAPQPGDLGLVRERKADGTFNEVHAFTYIGNLVCHKMGASTDSACALTSFQELVNSYDIDSHPDCQKFTEVPPECMRYVNYFHCDSKPKRIFPSVLSHINAQVSRCFSQSFLPSNFNMLSASLHALLELNKERDDQDPQKEMARSVVDSLGYQVRLLKFESNYKALNPSLSREEVKNLAEEVPGFLGVTPLIRAVKENDLVKVKLIAESGANLETRDQLGNSALITALFDKRDEAAKILILNHANPNTASEDGIFPLFVAIARPNKELIKLMLSHHADPNQFTSQGNTPLMLAVGENDSGIVELLLRSGADPTLKKESKPDLLTLAKKSKNRFLLDLIESAIQSWKANSHPTL